MRLLTTLEFYRKYEISLSANFLPPQFLNYIKFICSVKLFMCFIFLKAYHYLSFPKLVIYRRLVLGWLSKTHLGSFSNLVIPESGFV